MSKYNIAVLGVGGVGKSALIIRFTKGLFVDRYDPTVEDTYTKQIEVDGEQIVVEILDTAGSDFLSAVRDLYLKRGQGFILVFSVAKKSSFLEIPKILDHITEVKGTADVPLVLVGNQCDLAEREVSQQSIDELKNQHNIKFYIETSAKLMINVNEAFDALFQQVHQRAPKKKDKKKGNCTIL